VLATLPRGLESTYDQILQRISDDDADNAMTLLQWLALAMQPLNTKELAIVVAFDQSTMTFDDTQALSSPDDVITICSSLVTKGTDDRVSLAHASVREYLVKKPRMLRSAELCINEIGKGNASIVACCLTYILKLEKNPLYQSLLKEDVDSLFPLAFYAAIFWPGHYKGSTKETSLLNIVMQVFQQEGFLNWIRVNDPDFDRPHRGFNGQPGPLYYASVLGLPEVAEKLVTQDDVNAQGGEYGSALQGASSNGHLEIVKVLLASGADVNAQGGEYGSALQGASENGHLEIVKVLLASGADVNAQGGRYGSALQGASENGDLEIVKVLLASGGHGLPFMLQ